MLLQPSQARALLEGLKKRQKRKMRDFTNDQHAKWPTTINYGINVDFFTSGEKNVQGLSSLLSPVYYNRLIHWYVKPDLEINWNTGRTRALKLSSGRGLVQSSFKTAAFDNQNAKMYHKIFAELFSCTWV